MQTQLTNRKRTLIFINIMVTGIASSMLATSMTTALPPVIKDFGVSLTTGQWLTSGYSLAMGIVMPLTAFMITKFPTKPLYMTGVGVFIVGVLTCIIAPNFGVMMIGRVVQACGNGILVSMAQVIILSIFPREQSGARMGMYGLAVTAAPVLAPTLAGILVDTIGWRSIFIIAAVIMGISFAMAAFVFANVLELQDKKFDAISFTESIFAFGGVTLGIGNISDYGLMHMATYIPLGLGLVAAILFTKRQFRQSNPFLDLKVLKCREYLIAVIGSMLMYFVLMGTAVIMPVYVQTIMGYSAVVSGLVTLPGALATAISSPFAGRFYDKMGIKMLFVGGSAFLLASNIGMVFITMNTPIIVASIINVFRNLALGCLLMPILTWGTSYVEPKKLADATSILSSFRTIAGSIGAAVFVGIMTKVGESSKATYGTDAAIHGFNMAFLAMSFFTAIMLLMAIFGVKEKHEKEDENTQNNN